MPVRRIASTAALLVLNSGCNAAEPLPGTPLGSFTVTAILSSNTCGNQVHSSNPWKFNADMSLSGNTLYFRADNEDAISAPLDSDNTATYTAVANSYAPTDQTCSISLKTIYTIELDSATDPKTSTGSFRFEYSALHAKTCSSQLSANGGVYDELPCEVEYLYTALKE